MLFSRICNVRHSFLSFSNLIFYFIHKLCCVTSHDESFRFCLFLVVNAVRLPRSIMGLSLRTLRIAHFRREEVLHDEGELVASHPKKFSQVSPIDRAPQPHFSTLEKTKIKHNPLLNNLLVTVYQVSLIDRLPQQISQDLDIHARSSPGLMKLKTTRSKASSLLNSS